MEYQIHIHRAADIEMEEAMVFIAHDSPERAVRWFHQLMERIESLARFPERCHLAPESETMDEPIRQQLHGPYRILFKIVGDTVHVLHVRHGARRPMDEI